ncbi:dipeptidyl-peptidase 7. Serine peptidase. MEROPS family S46 [Lutibacter oricola]|uniref:Dipeptidyl-peptidase n=1 Tax=Lutibacter oricola TaxID=762486 RepID=A0A1H2Z871_9FLAO|nr:S46 family peptidase [Lutibacter oricola]SDX13526.1 dipeptidyl-peptidase 7. Serine peptidase. MEROPS family S46 [Lutibacter oricola]
MRNFKSYLLLAIAFISISAFAQVDTKKIQGGMWIPSLLEGMNEDEMQLLGSKMTAEDIYSVNKSSLKDAIGHFGNGCTSELISSKGLLLTNHHCGYGRIQSHSSVEHDYLKDGFWAKSMEDELPNEGLTVTFIKTINDVTSEVMAGVTEDMDEAAKASLVNKNIQKITKEVPKEEWQSAYIKEFYKGNQYLIFVVETFKDVRLVGAPPTSIGKYGSDTDNWMWPRHTGDFSMFRVYADANNRPAEYSKDNKPYKPAYHLPISLDGVEKYDFSMVFGFPGRTNEYLPAVGVDQIVNKLNPAKIEIRENALEIINEFMRADQAIKIQYASKYASVANYWKKWIGESQGIHQTNAIELKRELEADFTKAVKEKDLVGYSTLLADFETLYKEIESVSLARDYWIEVAYRNVELLGNTFSAYQLEQAFTRGGEAAFEQTRTRILDSYKGKFKNYSAKVDEPVFARLVSLYAEKAPKEYVPENMKNVDINTLTKDIFASSKFTSLQTVEELLSGSGEEVMKKLNADKGYAFGKELHTIFYTQIEPKYQQLNLQLAAVQKKYMKALMEVFPNKRFFPDANSTLRVNYGRVEGYQPKDGVFYTTSTTLKGVMEKYKAGDYEFDVPQKLRDLYKAKDYGQYGENGTMPVNYLSTNHMTGGNSGSPIVDGEGNMTGLAFDTTWEGTMSDLYFDADIVRSIAVDVRYVLFIIDKYAGATNLIDEMTLVHPKKK